MTLSEVRERVERIRRMADDPEGAHSEEDSLYRDLLQAIAAGVCADAPKCAFEALKSKDIDFPRWCA